MLAETDVINMVSRGISAPNILKGIHLSMAGRLSKLLKSIGATHGVVMVTGGLALDAGLVAALEEDVVQDQGHEDHDPQPPGFDLCGGDRRRAVGGVPSSRSSPRLASCRRRRERRR